MRLPIFILCLLSVLPISGQVTLTLEPSTITLDETATLTLAVKGGLSRGHPDLPLPEGLKVRSTPRQDFMVQGDRETRLQYTIEATSPGTYTIGPYRLNLPDGPVELAAQPLTVTPVQVARKHENIFFTLESSDDHALVRQALELRIRFHSRHRINDISQMAFDTEGFTLGNWQEIRSRPVQIDGEQFRVRTFIAQLAPTAPGTYTLDPEFKVEMMVPGNMVSGPLGMMTRQRTLETVRVRPVTPLELEITNPPVEGRPDSYAGHLGQFHLDASISPTDVAVGDPITLRVRLSGTGSLKDALPPSLEESGDFNVYDPRVVEEDMQRDGLSGRKVLEQVLIPRHADITEVPQIEFSYYNPAREQYEVRTAGPFPIEITQAAGGGQGPRSVSSIDAGPAPETSARILGEDLVYLKSDAGTLRPLSSLRPGWIFAGASGMPLVLWGLVAGITVWRDRTQTDPETKRRKKAPRRLREDLQRLAADPDRDPADLYSDIWTCLADYARDRLGLPPGEVNPMEVTHHLPESVSPETRRELADWMERCERARFASTGHEMSGKELVPAFEDFMLKLDREVAS